MFKSLAVMRRSISTRVKRPNSSLPVTLEYRSQIARALEVPAAPVPERSAIKSSTVAKKATGFIAIGAMPMSFSKYCSVCMRPRGFDFRINFFSRVERRSKHFEKRKWKFKSTVRRNSSG